MKLILGDGLLGNEIRKQTNWDYISRRKNGIDFRDIHTYTSYIDPVLIPRYDVVINCIAQTKTINETNKNKKNDWEVNYKGVMNLTDCCNEFNIKLIHISTDYVYAKSKKLATEEDISIHYDNSYTYTKLLADNYIMARSNDYLILRSSFKPNPFPYDKAWIDLIGNFDYVDVIAGLMIKLIKYQAVGIYNVGTELKSVYDLAKKTNPNVKPIHKGDNFIDSNDISMNTTKMENFLNRKK